MVVHQARVVTVVLSSHRPNNGASQLLRKGLQAAPMLSTKARRLVLGEHLVDFYARPGSAVRKICHDSFLLIA
jgi:hypothetical protein